jgi:hypothetical protein
MISNKVAVDLSSQPKRLAAPLPFLVPSVVGSIICEGTIAAKVQNKEAERLELGPDCHLAQISLRECAGEHVLHCDGSLKGLDTPTI